MVIGLFIFSTHAALGQSVAPADPDPARPAMTLTAISGALVP